MTETSTEQLKREFADCHGYWGPELQQLLEADPTYFKAYAALLAVPTRTNRLTPRDRELISVAINAAATHLHRPAVKLHISNALRAGADPTEIIEACQLASVLGTHTMSFGVPILMEELRAAGRDSEIDFGGALRARARAQAELRDRPRVLGTALGGDSPSCPRVLRGVPGVLVGALAPWVT